MAVEGKGSKLKSGKWHWVARAIVLFACALIVYLPSFKTPFHFDDIQSIINNPYIRMTRLSLETLSLAAFQDFKQNRPLSNLSFALNYHFNLLNPFGYHLINFIFHLVSGFCLWLLLERIFTRRMKNKSSAALVAFLSALLWLVHPINTQAVTYIVQRHSVMAGAFSLLCLLCFDLGRSERKTGYYILCGLFCLCALLCKETAYVLPVFIFLYDRFFFQELTGGWLRQSRKWIVGLLVFYLVLSALVFRGRMTGKMASDYAELPFTLYERSLTQGRVLLSYIGLILYPAGSRLNLQHDPEISRTLFHPLTTVPAFLVIFGLIGFALAKARKYPMACFGILWYFGQLAIEALPLPIDIMNEHRLYLASIPVLVIIPYAFGLRLKSLKAATAPCLLICLFMGVLTYERNKVWLTRVSLWGDTVMKSPRSYWPWHNLCSYLIDDAKFRSATTACVNSLLINDTKAETHANMGMCLMQVGNFRSADEELLRAVEIEPKFGGAYFYLGLSKFMQKDLPKAVEYFNQAMALGLKDARLYFNLGEMYERLDQPEKSFDAFKTALALRPEWGQARYKVASVLAGKGDCDRAVALLKSAPVKDPEFQKIFDYCSPGQTGNQSPKP